MFEGIWKEHIWDKEDDGKHNVLMSAHKLQTSRQFKARTLDV